MHLDYNHVCSINFQIRQIPPQAVIFLVKKACYCVGQYFSKKISALRSYYHRKVNRKKTSITTKKLLQSFVGHDHWHCQ